MEQEGANEAVWQRIRGLEVQRPGSPEAAKSLRHDLMAQLQESYGDDMRGLEDARGHTLGEDYYQLRARGRYLDALRDLAPVVRAGEKAGKLPTDGSLDRLWELLWTPHPLGIRGLRGDG